MSNNSFSLIVSKYINMLKFPNFISALYKNACRMSVFTISDNALNIHYIVYVHMTLCFFRGMENYWNKCWNPPETKSTKFRVRTPFITSVQTFLRLDVCTLSLMYQNIIMSVNSYHLITVIYAKFLFINELFILYNTILYTYYNTIIMIYK